MRKRLKNGKQGTLLNYYQEYDEMELRPSVDRYEGAFLWSAVGDALGWPTEFLGSRGKKRLPFKMPIEEFISWKKLVGGRWWGYYDEIQPGEYSDDTQLTLSVARCIDDSGAFEPAQFAYSELPLWLHYQRGGGRSVKTAARSILRIKSEWNNNFYHYKTINYRNAGANGAAMRNLPIILANINNEHQLITDSLYNAIITHGHPRAILGAILLGYSIRYALSDNDIENGMIEYLLDSLSNAWMIIVEDSNFLSWMKKWNNSKKLNGSFESIYKETIGEIYTNLVEIPYYIEKPEKEYYSLIGALDPSTKGSGVATVCCSIYQFIKNSENPENALFSTVNMLGSDTDTIAVFLGALVGARFGRKNLPINLDTKLQDREYLLKTAQRLHQISCGNISESSSFSEPISKKEAYLNILSWEIGMQEMFWDAIGEGGIIIHPALGRGIITQKTVQPIHREGYVAKLLHVRFDIGQTCLFHSRVQKNGNISESLAKDVMRQLNGF